MLQAKSFVRGEEFATWSVKLQDTDTKRIYWFDVWLQQDYYDITGDWNQYIFCTYDSEDCARRAFQDDCNNFEDAFNAATELLLESSEVYQDDKTNWLCSLTEKGWRLYSDNKEYSGTVAQNNTEK